VLSHDLVLRDALALAFMVALQEAIDIAYHVVADEGRGIPDSHRAAFELLAAHGLLAADLVNELSAATAMRNRIAMDMRRSISSGCGRSYRTGFARSTLSLGRWRPGSLPPSNPEAWRSLDLRRALRSRTDLAEI
jgi:hypothetical protein